MTAPEKPWHLKPRTSVYFSSLEQEANREAFMKLLERRGVSLSAWVNQRIKEELEREKSTHDKS
jgi:hypothetical protein